MQKIMVVFFIAITVMSPWPLQSQSFAPAVKPFISVQPGSIAITDVKIIDGTGGPAKEHQTLLIQN